MPATTTATTLQQGAEGAAVATLQRALNAFLKPTPPLKDDGDFGQKTRDAVAAAQARLGLAATGIADAALQDALRAKLTPGALTPPDPAAGEARWMRVAEGEIGVRERPGPGQENRRIVEYHATTSLRAKSDEVPWCASFVNWVMKQVNIRGTGSAAAASFLQWGRPLDEPRPGCVAVIKRKGQTSDAATGSATGNHVAFYLSHTATHIKLLGGNQGDAVKVSEYPFAKYDVRGYRWPV